MAGGGIMLDNTDSNRESQTNLGARLLLIVFLVLYTLVFAVRLPTMFSNGQMLLLIQAIAYGVLCIVGIVIFRHDIISGIKNWKPQALKNILWFVGFFVASTFIATIAAIPAYSMGYEDTNNANAVLLMIQAIGKPLAVLIIGFLGPILEECIYRAFLIGKVKSKIPLWLCVVMSSLLFACMHLHGFGLLDFLGILPLFAQALMLGIAYAVTGNITIPIAMHISNNMIAIMSY
jgi:membrane protease YdiL (CAAX protease family)